MTSIKRIQSLREQSDFLLLAGQTLAQISDRMVQLGLIWFITSRFGEGFLIWYLVMGGLPHALLVRFSGPVIQKVSSLKTVLYTDLARGCVYVLAFTLVIVFPEWLQNTHSPSTSVPALSPIVWLLFLSVILANIFSAFFNPAILSLAVEIKAPNDIQKLTAKLSSISSFATILGPILGLYVFNAFHLSGLFIIAGASYFLSACALSLIKKNDIKVNHSNDSLSETKKFSLLQTHRIIGVMLLTFLGINLFLSPLQILMPSMAKNLFGNSFNSLAIMETFLGIGILVGGAILSIYSVEKRKLFWAWSFLTLLSFSYLGFTYSGLFNSHQIRIFDVSFQINFLGSALFLFVIGLTLGMANILILNILQTQPSTTDVPKVMSYVNLISTATLPFSLALLGLLQRSYSIDHLGQGAGLVLVIFIMSSYFNFRRFGSDLFNKDSV